MTQASDTQRTRRQPALRNRSAPHSLAARRAAFAAQMRDMALSDLEQVAERLKSLQGELERNDARKWTQLEVAQEAGVPYRTYQSWVGAKVENATGEGYDKLAAFYTKRLGRKITRQWIVFGDAGPAKAPVGGLSSPEAESPERLARLEAQVDEGLAKIEVGLAGLAELKSGLAEVRLAQEEMLSRLGRIERKQGGQDSGSLS